MTEKKAGSVHPWDERYGGDAYFYGTDPNDFLRGQVQRIRPGGKVLCLAEGEGRNAVFLAERQYAAFALDQSAVGLEKAKRLAILRGVQMSTRQADLANLSSNR